VNTSSVEKRGALKSIGLFSVSMVIVVFTLSPLAWLVICSFIPDPELYRTPPPFFPTRLYLGNYQFLWGTELEALSGGTPGVFAQARNMLTSVANSLIVGVSVTVICLILGVLAAYSIARVPMRGSSKSLFYIFFSRLLPSIAILVPIYVIIQALRLLDSLLGIMLVHTAFAIPFFVWVLFVYFKSIPQSIEDAARIDGCSRFQQLRKITLPISRPGLIAASIFAFMTSYNEFLFASTLSNTIASRTASATLTAVAQGMGRYSVALFMACDVVAILPPIALVLIFRKQVMEGLLTAFRR
jgi:multiple sugar transport system permease protein